MANDPRFAELTTMLQNLRHPKTKFVEQMLSDAPFDFAAHLERLVSESGLPAEDVIELQPILADTKRVYFDCVLAKSLTPEIIQRLDEYGEDYLKWKELYPAAFGELA